MTLTLKKKTRLDRVRDAVGIATGSAMRVFILSLAISATTALLFKD